MVAYHVWTEILVPNVYHLSTIWIWLPINVTFVVILMPIARSVQIISNVPNAQLMYIILIMGFASYVLRLLLDASSVRTTRPVQNVYLDSIFPKMGCASAATPFPTVSIVNRWIIALNVFKITFQRRDSVDNVLISSLNASLVNLAISVWDVNLDSMWILLLIVPVVQLWATVCSVYLRAVVQDVSRSMEWTSYLDVRSVMYWLRAVSCARIGVNASNARSITTIPKTISVFYVKLCSLTVKNVQSKAIALNV